MTPAQSPALLEISFFVHAPKPLDFCVRDREGGGGDEMILPVCEWLCVLVSLYVIYKYFYNIMRDS